MIQSATLSGGAGSVKKLDAQQKRAEEAWRAVDASLSPDGTKIAFVTDRNGNPEIYSMTLAGTSQKRLTNNPALDRDPVWSGDSANIAFTSNRIAANNFEIFRMKANGTLQTRLTTSVGADQSPTWSKDGSKIAFASSRDGNFEIYSMPSSGGAATRLTDGNSSADTQPAFSPDGSLVAFTSDRDGTANTNIFTISATGTQGGLQRLTTATARDEDAAWSRDGLRLVFMSTRITTANPEIYHDRRVQP